MSSQTALPNPPAPRPAWLLFILTLQGQQPAVRMRVWRALKALGTAVLRDGVYLLPNRLEFIEPLQAQSEEVTASGGSAQILEVNARDEQQETEFRQLFDRTPEYEKLMLEISGARKEIGDLDRAALSARLARLRRDYEAIALQDFFPGSRARSGARGAARIWRGRPTPCCLPTSHTPPPAGSSAWTLRSTGAAPGPPAPVLGRIAWRARG